MNVRNVTISALRQRISEYVRGVRERDEVVTITQHGRPTAVLLAHERYERLLAEATQLRALRLGESQGVYVAESGLAGLGSLAQDLGVDDLAEQHDHYLYGTPRR